MWVRGEASPNTRKKGRLFIMHACTDKLIRPLAATNMGSMGRGCTSREGLVSVWEDEDLYTKPSCQNSRLGALGSVL